MGMKRAGLTAVMLSAALVGCGAATMETGTPAVHELARLQAEGALDAERLGCVMELVRPAARALPEELAHLRQARANREAMAMSDHARSVQQGMHSGDVTTAAAREAASAMRQAAYLESQGRLDEAATTRLWSSYSRERAEELAMIWIRGPDSGPLWSDEEAQLLIEYADLMAESTRVADDARAERIQEIQASHPHVMERYASLLLALYKDPGVACEPM